MNQINKKPKACLFCVNNIKSLNYYRHLDIVKKFVTPYAKILASKRTGTCSKHQRMISNAIKRARFMALLPFTYNQ